MEPIRIDITLLAPAGKVWEYYTGPEHIVRWNFAHETWHCPAAENDLRPGGMLKTRMEARDGSFGFDFEGTYDEIIPNEKIRYHLEDGRQVEILFHEIDATTTNVEITFDPEKQNPVEMQREGWYSILNNFHTYVENH